MFFAENLSISWGEIRELTKNPACVHKQSKPKIRHKLSHQKADGGEADVELLVLQAKAAGYIHYNLEARARHGGKEVCHYQLQALESCSDQWLPARKQDMPSLSLRSRTACCDSGYNRLFRMAQTYKIFTFWKIRTISVLTIWVKQCVLCPSSPLPCILTLDHCGWHLLHPRRGANRAPGCLLGSVESAGHSLAASAGCLHVARWTTPSEGSATEAAAACV